MFLLAFNEMKWRENIDFAEIYCFSGLSKKSVILIFWYFEHTIFVYIAEVKMNITPHCMEIGKNRFLKNNIFFF